MNQRQRAGRWSRWRLTLLAMGGTAAFHVVLMLPLAFVLALNALWFNLAYGYWMAAATMVFFWWTYQPTWSVPGRLVTRSEAPALFAELDAMSDAFDAPRVHEVRLDDDFNAGALEAKRRGWPWARRRVVLLGVPLLSLCDAATVRAVLAHELGHFSRRHGRLGHWVYRARLGWMSYAEASTDEDDAIIDRAAVRFARWFGPWFARTSFAHSRQCEYEADACAAQMVGRQPMADALVRMQVLARRLARYSDEELPRLQATSPHPPGDVTARWLDAGLHAECRPAELGEVANHLPDPSDTHPSLQERLDALGAPVDKLQAAAMSGPSAGATWWNEWDKVVRAHDEAWSGRRAASWHREHQRAVVFGDELGALRRQGDTSAQRAWLEREYGDQDEACRIASALPEDAQARYVLGRVALARGQASGFDALEACVKLDAAWALPARHAMAQEAALMADDAARARNAALLAKAAERRDLAARALWEAVHHAEVRPLALRPSAQAVARACLLREAHVLAAWSAALPGLKGAGRAYPNAAIILTIDPAVMREAGLDEDDVAGRALALLQRIVPEHWVTTVWTSYATEALRPSVQSMLGSFASQTADCVLLQRAVGSESFTTSPR